MITLLDKDDAWPCHWNLVSYLQFVTLAPLLGGEYFCPLGSTSQMPQSLRFPPKKRLIID